MTTQEIRNAIRRARNFIIGVQSYPSPRDPFGSYCKSEALFVIDQIASFGLFSIAADLAAQLEEAA